MRTEWFIGLAAVLLMIIGGVVIIDDAGSDDPTATESPSATSAPTDEPTTPLPTTDPSPTDEPSPSPSPTASASPSPSQAPTETASPSDSPSPTETQSRRPFVPGDDAEPVSRSSATFSNAGTRFSSSDGESRSSDFDDDACPVMPDEGEAFTQCRAAFSQSQDQWWAVTEVVSGSGHASTMWLHDGSGTFDSVAATASYDEAMELAGSDWPGKDDVITLDFGSQVEILSHSTSSGPIVAAVVPLDGDVSFDLVAQQVFLSTSGADRTTTVLDLSDGGGLEGQQTSLSEASDRSPEEVALIAYRAWVDHDRAAAAPYVTDEVDEALFDESPNSGGDVFDFSGTACTFDDGTFTCTFVADIGTMHWRVRSVEGDLRVVAINSTRA